MNCGHYLTRRAVCYRDNMRKAVQPPEVGNVFDELREGPFGQERRLRWHVDHVYTGPDGWVYVRLVREEDGTRKTLSQEVLLDRTRFRPVG